MRRLGFALALLLIGATSAQAQRGLSPAEKDELRKAYYATREIHSAIENLGGAVRVATGTTARTALANVWNEVRYLAREAGKGAMLLVGANTAGNTFSAFHAREDTPRATWVSDAFLTHHNNALGQVTTSLGVIDTALAVGGQVAAYTTALTALRANVTALQGYLNGINRTLSYQQARNLPFCRDADKAQRSEYDTRVGSCNVFGPHGNWPQATWHLQEGWQHLIESTLTTNLLAVYTANSGAESVTSGVPMDTTNGSVADILVSLGRLTDNFMVIVFNFAAISVTPQQCTFTPLRLVMRTVERILQFGDTTNSATSPADGGPIAGNPFFWVFRGNMASMLDGFNGALATRPQTHTALNQVLNDWLLAWRFTEGGFWKAFEMQSDLRNVIVASTSPPEHQPPAGTTVFPYYFPVERATQLRIYVRNAGSTIGRAPLVSGVNTVNWPGGITSVTVTIAGVGNPAGGTVTFSVAPPNDFHVQIERIDNTRLEENRRQPYPENDPAVGTVGPCTT